MLVEEPKKRNTAYKLRIGDVLKAKPFVDNGKFLFLEIDNNKISRVNVIANVIDKYSSEGEKRYSTLTLDDASGQIRIKTFGDDVKIIESFTQGDTLQIIGNVREYNNELYILPEIVKKVDPKWLLVRKLETKSTKKPENVNVSLKEIIIERIKNSEKEGGLDIDTLIMETDSSPESINKEIQKLLEEGMIYESRPGRLRYLG